VHVLLTYTKLGKAMRAISSNVTLARSCGIPTERVSDLAWLISGALCGIAGVILVINTTSFGSTTGADFLVIIIAAAMLGGVGHPYGAMVGALTLGLLTEVSAAVFAPVYKEVIALAVLVVVLLFRPQGILAAVATRREVAA
jgi:branched-chain amino acid transport system permease protein/neutral amino acid transport system permease protein